MTSSTRAIVATACSMAMACAIAISAATTQKPERGLETFDMAWRLVNDTYFDARFGGVDWAKVRDEFRPGAERAATIGELRTIIVEMLGRLGGSHLQLLPAELVDGPKPSPLGTAAVPPIPVATDGDLGLDVRALDGRLIVTSVISGQSAASAGVRPGWVVVSMDGAPFLGKTASDPRKADASITARALRRFLGPAGSTTTLAFLDSADHPVVRDLTRRPRAGERVKLPNLPEEYVVVTHGWLSSRPNARIGIIAFNTWAAPIVEQIRAARRDLRGADGLVIDLRGNAGGVADLIPLVAGEFLSDPVVLGKWIHRGGEMPIRTEANPEAFRGPVAIVIDGLSHSSTELFTMGMQSIKRARVFGEVSYGGALGAVYDRLPNGDVLEHAVVAFFTATGKTPESRGVVPDEIVALSRRRLIAGEDAACVAAQKWIQATVARTP